MMMMVMKMMAMMMVMMMMYLMMMYLDHVVVGDHVGDEDVAIFIGDDSSNKMILMIKGG